MQPTGREETDFIARIAHCDSEVQQIRTGSLLPSKSLLHTFALAASASNHGARRRHGQVLGPALQRRHRAGRRWLLKKEERRPAAR